MFVFLLFMLSSVSLSSGVFFEITMDSHSDECFYENLHPGDLFSLTYEVTSGGFRDVLVSVHSPDGKEIFKREHDSNGNFLFPVQLDGPYTVCFSNKINSKAPKTIMFVIDNPRSHVNKMEKTSNLTSEHIMLHFMMNDLGVQLKRIDGKQNFVHYRQKIHKKLSDQINRKVILWAIFESLIMLSVTVGQVYYLMRFFEVRRMV